MTKKNIKELDGAEMEEFFAQLGFAIFTAVQSANAVGHAQPLYTMRDYIMPSSLANEFIYDLFHDGRTERLFQKWCSHLPLPSERFARLIKKK